MWSTYTVYVQAGYIFPLLQFHQYQEDAIYVPGVQRQDVVPQLSPGHSAGHTEGSFTDSTQLTTLCKEQEADLHISCQEETWKMINA